MNKFGLEVFVFDWGDVKVPPGASADFAKVPKRRDGQPDRRYRIGRQWWTWFHEQNAIKGIDRTPSSFWRNHAKAVG
jgi:hypothetical protein